VSERCREITVRIYLVVVVDYQVISVRIKGVWIIW